MDIRRLVLILSFIYRIQCGCYPTGSRCVPDRPFQTTVTWKSCQEYCNKCRGYSLGDCKKVFTKLCDGKYQCRCSGSFFPRSVLPLDVSTCQLGV